MPMLDHPAAPRISLLEDKITSSQIKLNTRELLSEVRSQDVEQLIRETDEAFQAVATALADTRLSTKASHTPRALSSGYKRAVISVQTGVDSALDISSSTLATTSKPTEKLEQPPEKDITKMLGRERHTAHQGTVQIVSRSTTREVAINDADAFKRKLFRLEELPTRKLQHTDAERRKSVDSIWSLETAGFSPTDPFHLEGLSFRIKAAQRNLPPFPPPPYPPPAKPTLGRRSQIKRPKGRERKMMGREEAPITSISDTKMVFNEHIFPSPPRKHRNRSNLSKGPALPTISEVSTLELSTGQLDNYITLKSTLFTWTSPLFIHGPIRIERAVKEYSILSPQDETLDWTAFQMAILGTMDENGGDQRDDWGFEADELELDGIMLWWEGYGFDGFGALEGPPPKEVQLQDEDKEVFTLKQAWEVGTGVGEMNDSMLAGITQRFKHTIFHGQSDIGNGAGHGAPGSGKVIPFSDSLPPSPMLDLAVYSPLMEKEEEMIPMGFNLGHDLGDFLSWEAKYMQTILDK